MKAIKTAASALILAASLLVVNVPTASAAPVYNCQNGYTSSGLAYSTCSQGGPNYRTNVLCQNIFTRSSRVVQGSIVRLGNPSYVYGCPNWYEQYYGTPWATAV